jgi:RNA polymerase sigma factor (sigma-70 family)
MEDGNPAAMTAFSGILPLVQMSQTLQSQPHEEGYHRDRWAPRMSSHEPQKASDPAASLDTTHELLARARAGDERSMEALFARCLPALRRWARGRLPRYARDLSDTQDIVQETVLHTLNRLDAFEPRHQGALQAYLREAVANRIRDQIRRVQRRPSPVELVDAHADAAPSPLEHAIGREGIERYEAALHRLKPSDREAIVARIELQQSYEEVAIALGKPNANAARVAVTRALARLVEEMGHER